MVSNRVRLVLHYVVRLVELALLYGHFLGALFFASSHLAVLFAQHNEAYTLSPAAVASPLFVMLGCLVLCFTAVFVWEMRVQGQPRILPPSTFQRVARTALRWCIMIGIAVWAGTSWAPHFHPHVVLCSCRELSLCALPFSAGVLRITTPPRMCVGGRAG